MSVRNGSGKIGGDTTEWRATFVLTILCTACGR